eukprot:UN13463
MKKQGQVFCLNNSVSALIFDSRSSIFLFCFTTTSACFRNLNSFTLDRQYKVFPFLNLLLYNHL